MYKFNDLLESLDTRSVRAMMEALNEADAYCDYYKDENGFWGTPGEVYAADMLKLDMEDYWEDNKGYDPVLDEYDNMDEWINDTLAHMTCCTSEGTCVEDLSSDIRKNKLKHDDEIDAEYAKDGDTEVQFQDRGMNTRAYDLKTNRWMDKQPRTASHTWGRVWKNGKMIKSMEGPKYQVRQDMARFLDDNKEEDIDEGLLTNFGAGIPGSIASDVQALHDIGNEIKNESLKEDKPTDGVEYVVSATSDDGKHIKFITDDKVESANDFTYTTEGDDFIDSCDHNAVIEIKIRKYVNDELSDTFTDTLYASDIWGEDIDESLKEGKFTDRVKKAASAARETDKIYKEIKKDPEKKGMTRQEKRRQAINNYLNNHGYDVR